MSAIVADATADGNPRLRNRWQWRREPWQARKNMTARTDLERSECLGHQ
jgi:hypothetical protein